MKRVIAKKLYDTDFAECLWELSTDGRSTTASPDNAVRPLDWYGRWTHGLYRSKKGVWFEAAECSNTANGHDASYVRPLSDEVLAREWQHVAAVSEYLFKQANLG